MPITGYIRALQDTTPDIRFEVNLPTRWNGRALQMGGGGYNGTIVSGTEPMSFAPDSTPLAAAMPPSARTQATSAMRDGRTLR